MNTETKCRECGKYNGTADSAEWCQCPRIAASDVSEDTPPEVPMPDLTAETLAMLEAEAAEAKHHATALTQDYPANAEASRKYSERYAHAAACVRFVAALDAGDVLAVMSVDYHSPGVPRQQWTVITREMLGAHGDTALAAFRAATQDHHTGGDDGQ